MNLKTTTIVIYIVCIGLVLLFIGGVILPDIKEENKLFKTLLIANADWSEVSLDSQKADSYYIEAGYNYEDKMYKSLESNCRLARGYYLETSQGYKKIKSTITSLEIKDPLIDIYQDMLDSIIEVTNNMYEACEHFESTARYYDTYYNMNVPYGAYDDTSYDMGTAELELHNEKIREHDRAVEEYNQLLSDYKVELEMRLDSS